MIINQFKFEAGKMTLPFWRNARLAKRGREIPNKPPIPSALCNWKKQAGPDCDRVQIEQRAEP